MKPPEPPLPPSAPPAVAATAANPAVEAVFAEPWQAQAFAITLQLHERGLFDWGEWTSLLAREIRLAPPAEGAGTHYYRHWLNALEKLIVAKDLGTERQLRELERAWAAAAERTPHGQPIVL